MLLLTSLLLAQHLIPPLNIPRFPDYSENAHQAVVEAAQSVVEAQAVQYTAPVIQYAPLPTNAAKLYIYEHESGNDPTRWNSEGCVGIGQACPASKLLAICPNLDYGCEDAWFSNYAVQRYGGWQQAYNYWLVHHNW